MSSAIIARANQLVEELNLVEGITAVVDPAHVSANLPCVLVAPPRITYGRLAGGPSEVLWRLIVLGPGLATLSAVAAMTELLELVEEAVPVETAEPGTYQVGTELVACYVATFNDDPATWPPTEEDPTP
jgi:hypothetical protein